MISNNYLLGDFTCDLVAEASINELIRLHTFIKQNQYKDHAQWQRKYFFTTATIHSLILHTHTSSTPNTQENQFSLTKELGLVVFICRNYFFNSVWHKKLKKKSDSCFFLNDFKTHVVVVVL